MILLNQQPDNWNSSTLLAFIGLCILILLSILAVWDAKQRYKKFESRNKWKSWADRRNQIAVDDCFEYTERPHVTDN